MVDGAQKKYRENPDVKARVDGRTFSTHPSGPATEYIRDSLFNLIIKIGEEFHEHDALDLTHAIVASAWSEYVVHDQKWADRLKGIKLPTSAAKIYAVTELDQFLADIRNA